MISFYGKFSIYGNFLQFQSIRNVWQNYFQICWQYPYLVIVFVIQKFVVFRFLLLIFIAVFRWQPLCYKQSPAFKQKIQKKKLFISATTHETYIVCRDYCIAHHDDKTCCLPACSRYRIVLLGKVEELLMKLDTFCFTYEHVDSLYTLFKYRFSGKVIAKSGQVFDNVQQAVDFKHKIKGVARMPTLQKRDSWGKSSKALVQLLWKHKNNADRQLSGCRKNQKS